MSGVCDCAGLLVVKPFQREDVAFRPAVRRQHPGIGPVSQLDTQPVVSPVNASRRTSRFAAHHSGPGRLAIPYPVKDFHLLSSRQLAWRIQIWVIFDCYRDPARPAGQHQIADQGCETWPQRHTS